MSTTDNDNQPLIADEHVGPQIYVYMNDLTSLS
jgi:hypothetical protein